MRDVLNFRTAEDITNRIDVLMDFGENHGLSKPQSLEFALSIEEGNQIPCIILDILSEDLMSRNELPPSIVNDGGFEEWIFKNVSKLV